ncbi:MAG: M14 family zinc carboxypeptidase [Marinicellaceae bacterium]
MIKKLILLTLLNFSVNAVVLEDYLPENTRYDISIPTPKAVTGIEVGERHYRHDQIIHYLSVIAASSSRARLVEYGMTNEGRRLVLLFISSDKNMENLDALVKDKNILKVWNGFSVHGNEASGANASIIYAYNLVAGYSDLIDKILNETVIIIDPTINPDGYDRFVTDVNSMRGMIDNKDSNDSAHQEQIPNGRTNHYWFDLNRDWLLLSQTESRARIKQFHKWQPHVIGDHHEMGSHNSFFFQPGILERTNPLIPKKNIEFTNRIGDYHAQTLSEKGMRFYTKESFDDFYPGKGSTYPDLHGSVGILFEQASAKGGFLKTKEGMRTLVEGIDNQFRTAMSTLVGAFDMKAELLEYKNNFFILAKEQARKEKFKGYVFDLSMDKTKAIKLKDFLSLHQIEFKQLKSDVTVDGQNFPAKSSLYIPVEQPQFTLIKSLFSSDTSFRDNTFYDVSSWNLAMAWGLKYATIKESPATESISINAVQNDYDVNAIAYAFNWSEGNAPAGLNYLQSRNITTKITTKPFTINRDKKKTLFNPGTIIIDSNSENRSEVLKAMANVSEFFQIKSHALTKGLNDEGVDLGSPSISSSIQPKPLLLFGEGINSYQAGSIWHLFDTDVGLPLTKITKEQLKKISLNQYTHIILPSGEYFKKEDPVIEKISKWVKLGGHVISFQQSAHWAETQLQGYEKQTEIKEIVQSKSYESYDQDLAQNTIGGAIIAANADLSHPLAYGMYQQKQFVLLKGNNRLNPSISPYSTPLRADKKALAAGYVSEEKIKLFNDNPLVIADKIGQGSIIKFGFNPNFRGYWLGTQKWLINAVYFAHLIKPTVIKK